MTRALSCLFSFTSSRVVMNHDENGWQHGRARKSSWRKICLMWIDHFHHMFCLLALELPLSLLWLFVQGCRTKPMFVNEISSTQQSGFVISYICSITGTSNETSTDKDMNNIRFDNFLTARSSLICAFFCKFLVSDVLALFIFFDAWITCVRTDSLICALLPCGYLTNRLLGFYLLKNTHRSRYFLSKYKILIGRLYSSLLILVSLSDTVFYFISFKLGNVLSWPNIFVIDQQNWDEWHTTNAQGNKNSHIFESQIIFCPFLLYVGTQDECVFVRLTSLKCNILENNIEACNRSPDTRKTQQEMI